MAAYYNEHDPFAAAWLRELIADGQIAPGDVDERSIIDVRPRDLAHYRQCHFFGGIGGWSYALRLAGWPDDRPVWTGSCPCQPFSSAGAQTGGHDPRDLWPAWFQLLRECRPDVVFGEQVEAAIGHGWLDRVHDDLEREGYAVGAVCLPAPCVGAFTIRQRLWFVADTGDGRQSRQIRGGQTRITERRRLSGLADAGAAGRDRLTAARLHEDGQPGDDAARRGAVVDVGDTSGTGLQNGEPQELSGARRGDEGRTTPEPGRAFWAGAEWIACRDGKWRPAQPGIFPLASGVPNRVGTLRGAGNSIVPQVAAEVIRAYMAGPGMRP